MPCTEKYKYALFLQLLAQLHSTDRCEFEPAFDALRRSIDDVKPYLLKAMKLANDAEVKGALLELLGKTKDPHFIPFIADELEADVPKVRFWAWIALQDIGTDEARSIVDDFDVRTLRRRSATAKSRETGPR